MASPAVSPTNRAAHRPTGRRQAPWPDAPVNDPLCARLSARGLPRAHRLRGTRQPARGRRPPQHGPPAGAGVPCRQEPRRGGRTRMQTGSPPARRTVSHALRIFPCGLPSGRPPATARCAMPPRRNRPLPALPRATLHCTPQACHNPLAIFNLSAASPRRFRAAGDSHPRRRTPILRLSRPASSRPASLPAFSRSTPCPPDPSPCPLR